MESSLPVGAVEPPASRPPRNRLVIVLAGLLAGSLVGNVVQFLRTPEPPQTATGPTVESYDDRGRVVARFTYRDGDSFPSRAEQLDRAGRVDSISYDDDTDGWYSSVRGRRG